MNGQLQKFLDYILLVKDWGARFLEPALPALYIAATIISIFLLVTIIFIIVRTGWLDFKSENWIHFLQVGDLSKRKAARAWKRILQRINAKEPQEWRVAVLEADDILDEILKLGGYLGNTVDERFAHITPEILTNAEEVHQAHKVRDRAVQDLNYAPTREEAIYVLKIYKKAFQEFGFID